MDFKKQFSKYENKEFIFNIISKENQTLIGKFFIADKGLVLPTKHCINIKFLTLFETPTSNSELFHIDVTKSIPSYAIKRITVFK